MSDRSSSSPAGIPSTAYTRDYYMNCCQGHEEFVASRGQQLPLRLSIPLDLAGVRPGKRVLDVGCGRGELLIHCAQRGALAWGLDYSDEALHLAQEMLQSPEHAQLQPSVRLVQGSVLDLPFESSTTDLVFMLDVVEHLYPQELAQAFTEIYRVLKPGGRLIVHTMPNLWYYRWGYPQFRAVQRLRGHKLPADPRDRWSYNDVHVNEQTPVTLRNSLQRSGLRTKVWLRTAQSYAYEDSQIFRTGMELLARVYPFRLIFCNDIFAIGLKP
jgi:ubiquinone/menaquinone biosynthesis C-methylase UbiE